MHYKHTDMTITCSVRATYNLPDVSRLNFNVTKDCWADAQWMAEMVNDMARPFSFIRDNRFVYLTEATTPEHPFRYLIRDTKTGDVVGDLVFYPQDYVLNVLP